MDHAALLDEAVRAELNAIFEDRGIIVFQSIEQSPKMHVALSKVFGPLKDHPTKTTPRTAEDEAQGVIDMHYVPSEDPSNVDGLVEIERPTAGALFALAFRPLLQRRTQSCRGPTLARDRAGGRTDRIHGRHRTLPPIPKDLRDQIEKHKIIYTLDTRLTKMRFGVNFKPLGDPPKRKNCSRRLRSFRARCIRRFGRGTVASRCCMSVPGWRSGSSTTRIRRATHCSTEVCHEVNRLGQGTSAYWHDWKTTDMVIWDNWRMLHAVEGCDAKYERRTMRTTIKGDYGLGYFEHGKKIGEVYRDVAA